MLPRAASLTVFMQVYFILAEVSRVPGATPWAGFVGCYSLGLGNHLCFPFLSSTSLGLGSMPISLSRSPSCLAETPTLSLLPLFQVSQRCF